MPALQLLLPEISACDEAANECHPAVFVGAPTAQLALVGGAGGTSSDTGNEKRKGRRPVHASAAARKAAYRAEKARIDYTDKPAIAATLEEIAAELDCSKNELMQSLVRFALTNRNWKTVGLYGARNSGVLQ